MSGAAWPSLLRLLLLLLFLTVASLPLLASASSGGVSSQHKGGGGAGASRGLLVVGGGESYLDIGGAHRRAAARKEEHHGTSLSSLAPPAGRAVLEGDAKKRGSGNAGQIVRPLPPDDAISGSNVVSSISSPLGVSLVSQVELRHHDAELAADGRQRSVSVLTLSSLRMGARSMDFSSLSIVGLFSLILNCIFICGIFPFLWTQRSKLPLWRDSMGLREQMSSRDSQTDLGLDSMMDPEHEPSLGGSSVDGYEGDDRILFEIERLAHETLVGEISKSAAKSTASFFSALAGPKTRYLALCPGIDMSGDGSTQARLKQWHLSFFGWWETGSDFKEWCQSGKPAPKGGMALAQLKDAHVKYAKGCDGQVLLKHNTEKGGDLDMYISFETVVRAEAFVGALRRVKERIRQVFPTDEQLLPEDEEEASGTAGDAQAAADEGAVPPAAGPEDTATLEGANATASSAPEGAS